MPQVKVESLKEGMVVTTEVRNMDNMLLMPAGCVLSEKHIGILNAWGITEIQVQAGEGVEEAGDALKKMAPEQLQKLTTELQAIFWEPSDRSPLHKELFELVLRRKAKHSAA